jgi:hypothetical protein
LNDHVCVRNVNSTISNPRKNNAVDLVSISEMLNNINSFPIRDLSIYHRNLEPLCILFEREDMVTKDNDLVPSRLMQSHKVVTRHILVRVVPEKSLFHPAFLFVVLFLEFHCHLAPDFNALDFGKVSSVL